MKEAVIVSTARTPIGKAYRGGFNNLGGASLGAASVAEAVKRAGIDPARIEDVIMGSALQQGATGSNIARQIALRAGLPVTVSGMTLDRQVLFRFDGCGDCCQAGHVRRYGLCDRGWPRFYLLGAE